ncbi:MAG TPA: hypothetical protein VFE51_04040 [Verrucomicrobiae bacterium]|nr:hypothetical protein [Verrucomicrobiae bacterium]
MIEGTLDKSTNLIKMSYSGRVDPEQTQAYVPRMQAMLAEVQPGFRLLTDLRRLETMDLGCVPFIEQVMDLCDDRGISMVVRIIPDPHKDIGLNIMSLFHYRRGVRIVTCLTMEQAETALANRG